MFRLQIYNEVGVYIHRVKTTSTTPTCRLVRWFEPMEGKPKGFYKYQGHLSDTPHSLEIVDDPHYDASVKEYVKITVAGVVA